MDRREVYKSHPVAVLRQEVMKHLNKEVLKQAKEQAKKMKKAELVEYMVKNDQHFKHIKHKGKKAKPAKIHDDDKPLSEIPRKKKPAKKSDGCPPPQEKVSFPTKKGEVGFCAKPKGRKKAKKEEPKEEPKKKLKIVMRKGNFKIVAKNPEQEAKIKELFEKDQKAKKPKKERTEKQKANDKRLGERAKARAGKKGFIAISEKLGDPYSK